MTVNGAGIGKERKLPPCCFVTWLTCLLCFFVFTLDDRALTWTLLVWFMRGVSNIVTDNCSELVGSEFSQCGPYSQGGDITLGVVSANVALLAFPVASHYNVEYQKNLYWKWKVKIPYLNAQHIWFILLASVWQQPTLAFSPFHANVIVWYALHKLIAEM